jgi:cytidylate kinase
VSDRVLIVAIDGPVGVGKSSVARGVSRRLGVPVLDTGAMYRALGLEVVERGVDPEDRAAVEALAAEIDLTLEETADGKIRVLMRGKPVGARIRDPLVTEATSKISIHPGVRRRMVDLQRAWGSRRGAVVEGRDIGTKVFPGTPHKFFLEASAGERARRRMEQWRAAGRTGLDPGEVERQIRDRDLRDRTRPDSPLTVDETYITIETDALSQEQVVEAIVEEIERRRAAD